MSSARVLIDPKRVGEAVTPPFDFSGKLAVANGVITAETIASLTSVTVTVWSGVDANPSVVYSGTSTIDSNSTRVLPKLIGGILGVIYNVAVLVLTTSGRTLELDGLMAITPGPM
jgi:hypothetical protein